MRILIVLSAGVALSGCPRADRPAAPSPDATLFSTPALASTEVDGSALVLVEAELASRLQRGQVGTEEFCEAEVPHLVLKGGLLELQCGSRSERWVVETERSSAGHRVLTIAGGRQVELEEQGRQRYRVIGSPCDRQPTVYVVFPEARSYRTRWLKSATCPTEDLKLAH